MTNYFSFSLMGFLEHLIKNNIGFILISGCVSEPFEFNLGILWKNNGGFDDPVFFRFEIFNLEVSFNYETQGWHLAGTIADDHVIFRSEAFGESDCLVPGECASHSKIHLYSVVDCVCLCFVGSDKVIIGSFYVWPCHCCKPGPFNFDGRADPRDNLNNLEGYCLSLAVAVQPEDEIFLSYC